MSRLQRLGQFLKESDTTTVWGKTDCCAWIAQWIERETGRALDRPAYRSKDEAYGLIGDAGGLVGLISPIMMRAGFIPAFARTPGDVGLMRVSFGAVGVIFCTNGIVAWRAEKGGVRYLLPREDTLVARWAMPI